MAGSGTIQKKSTTDDRHVVMQIKRLGIVNFSEACRRQGSEGSPRTPPRRAARGLGARSPHQSGCGGGASMVC